MNKIPPEEAYSFDDVLLVPCYSDVLPRDVITRTRLTRNITLNIPIVSAAMDTVTEARAAITMAREGGIGFIHRNMSVESQVIEVGKVKKSESGMIIDPVTIHPDQKIAEVLELMRQYRISGVPVIQDEQLVGIVTNRDLRFEGDLDKCVSEVMTRENLITVSEGIGLEESKKLLHQHRIEKLLVVDKDGRLTGMITIKDIEKIRKYPNACKDKLGRLRVGAAVGVGPDMEERADGLIRAGADVLCIDTSHGHSKNVIDAVKALKGNYKDLELIAGNVATAKGAEDLIAAGVDGVKIGIGPGSICTTRIVAGVGIPQVTAILNCRSVASKADVPLIADGGDQVLRGPDQGHRGRGPLRDDRRPFRRHRGKPRRADPLPGADLQGLPRHGVPGGHEEGEQGPLLPGRGRKRRQARPRRDRRTGPLSRAAVGEYPPAHRRAESRHGVPGMPQPRRAQGKGPV